MIYTFFLSPSTTPVDAIKSREKEISAWRIDTTNVNSIVNVIKTHELKASCSGLHNEHLTLVSSTRVLSKSPHEVNTLRLLIVVHHRTVNAFFLDSGTFAIHFSLKPPIINIVLFRSLESRRKMAKLGLLLVAAFCFVQVNLIRVIFCFCVI